LISFNFVVSAEGQGAVFVGPHADARVVALVRHRDVEQVQSAFLV
jgi:hypothetical protein